MDTLLTNFWNVSATFGTISRIFDQTLSLTRTMFNPAVIGSILVIIYVFAWIRMEELGDSKRHSQNEKLLAKKSLSKSGVIENTFSLSDYSDQYNGIWFGHNGFTELMAHVQRKVPLAMNPLCQPIQTLPEGILWRSSLLKISSLTNDLPLSPEEALRIIEDGFTCIWGDARFLAKDFICYSKINFHDSINFFNVYTTPQMFKRIGSISLSDFQKAVFNDAICFDHPVFPKIKIEDKQVLTAIQVLASSISKLV